MRRRGWWGCCCTYQFDILARNVSCADLHPFWTAIVSLLREAATQSFRCISQMTTLLCTYPFPHHIPVIDLVLTRLPYMLSFFRSFDLAYQLGCPQIILALRRNLHTLLAQHVPAPLDQDHTNLLSSSSPLLGTSSLSPILTPHCN